MWELDVVFFDFLLEKGEDVGYSRDNRNSIVW